MNVSHLLNRNIPHLDPHSLEEVSIVSHAHGDHVAFNPYSQKRIIICSKETAAIIRYRSKETNLSFKIIEYNKKVSLKKIFQDEKNIAAKYAPDCLISIYPAGHILGSSQILIETKEKSLLYSGDFKLQKSLTCSTLKFPLFKNQIDYLIMESTFGKPKYIFPDKFETAKLIKDFCEEALTQDHLPILLSYSLGKSQELIGLLQKYNFNLIVHGSIYNICKIYEDFNVDLGKYVAYSSTSLNSSAITKKSILIIPPQYFKSRMVTNIPNRRSAVVTGWAIDSSAKYLHKTDMAFPISDHADYKDLIEYATKINAKTTLITHGFALQLSKDLNKLNINAEPLEDYHNIRLFAGV